MDSGRIGRRLSFLFSRLDDPRRIQLRQGAFLEAYRRRGTADDIIEISHDLTKLRRSDGLHMRDALTQFEQPHMHPVQFTQDREYPLKSEIRLPEPTIPDRSFSELVRGRRSCRDFGGGPVSSPELSALLFAALGETGRATTSSEDENERPVEASLRSIPSGGALHPTRIFVAVLQADDLAPNIFHFDAPKHALEVVKPLRAADIATLFAAFPIHPEVIDLTSVAAIFFVATKFWRPRAKYGPRGYRYCLQEAGSACQNLCLAAGALGLAQVVLGGFYDDEVHACLEIDGVDHAVITAIAVGTSSPRREAEPRHAGF